jgi:FkbM family methyltransferase
MKNILYLPLVRIPAIFIDLFYRFIAIFNSKNKYHQLFYHNIGNRLNLQVVNDGIVFDASFKSPASRAERLLEKEPDMLHWINANMKSGEVLYDIGANIGEYSLYGALRNVEVVAFEPESSTYAILNKNIHLNKFDNKIKALNVALHDEDRISYLNISNYQPGKSCHTFHNQVNQDLKPFSPAFRQYVVGMKMDTLLEKYSLPFPDHVKIDVDGNEHKIIKGMENILSDKRLKSIAVEINMNLDEHMKIINILKSSGFVRLEEPEYINDTYLETGYLNYFFVRK